MGTGQDPTESTWQTQVGTLAIWCHSRLPVHRWLRHKEPSARPSGFTPTGEQKQNMEGLTWGLRHRSGLPWDACP